MRRKVYKALDKPSSLFGLRGTYITWGIVGIIIALFIALMVSAIFNSIVGTVVFVILSVVAYLYVVHYQSRFSERERDKWLSARKLPDVIVMPPVPLRKLSKYKLTFNEKRKGEKANAT